MIGGKNTGSIGKLGGNAETGVDNLGKKIHRDGGRIHKKTKGRKTFTIHHKKLHRPSLPNQTFLLFPFPHRLASPYRQLSLLPVATSRSSITCDHLLSPPKISLVSISPLRQLSLSSSSRSPHAATAKCNSSFDSAAMDL